MSGIEANRVIGLDKTIVENLQCDICSMILDNPLVTSCGHSFCRQCLKRSIDSGQKACAVCREAFTSKNSDSIPFFTTVSDNQVVLKDFVFTRVFKLNGVINHLKIRCHYIGCEESVEKHLLPNHLKSCVHRLCENCELIPVCEDHNCGQLLKKDRNEWKAKYEKSLETNEKQKKEIEDLKKKCSHVHMSHLQISGSPRPQTRERGRNRSNGYYDDNMNWRPIGF